MAASRCAIDTAAHEMPPARVTKAAGRRGYPTGDFGDSLSSATSPTEKAHQSIGLQLRH
jgi:hypothetical protein